MAKDTPVDPATSKTYLLNAKDNSNAQTALHAAALRGQPDATVAFTHFSAAGDAKRSATRDSMTALHYAVQKGHLPAIKALEAAGTKMDVQDKKKVNALIHVVKHGHIHI